jgi:hypothetical protein
MICRHCRYDFPTASSRCPECGTEVTVPRKVLMTRADVAAEEYRLRSKLRGRGSSYRWDRRTYLTLFTFIVLLPILQGAVLLVQHFHIIPDFEGVKLVTLIAWMTIVLVRGLRSGRGPLKSWQTDARKADYKLCPDCGYDLRGSIDPSTLDITCPECSREVAVADLKEIWTSNG